MELQNVLLKNDAGDTHEIRPDSRDAYVARGVYEKAGWVYGETGTESVRLGYVMAWCCARRLGLIDKTQHLDEFAAEWFIEPGATVTATPTQPAQPADS